MAFKYTELKEKNNELDSFYKSAKLDYDDIKSDYEALKVEKDNLTIEYVNKINLYEDLLVRYNYLDNNLQEATKIIIDLSSKLITLHLELDIRKNNSDEL